MTSLAIVIPTHNREAMLPRAIRSVLAHPRDDIEVVVVDDASSDRTPQMLAEIRDPRLRHARLPEKANGNVARNLGVRLTRAPVVAFLDSDDAFDEGRVDRLIAYFRDHPSVDVVLDGFTLVKEGRRIDPPPPLLSEHHTKQQVAELIAAHALPMTCSSIAVRRSAFLAVGGFDESLPRLQDWDLLLKLIASHQLALGTGSDVTKHQTRDSISRRPAGYVRSLDILVGKHREVFGENQREVLCYLATRTIVKAFLGGRFGVAWQEAQALSAARHLPRGLLATLLRYPQGRRVRRSVESQAGGDPRHHFR